MTVLIVYESMFGAAKRIATAIAEGISPTRSVTTVEVGEASDAIPSDVTLLVAGGPNHGFGLPRAETRRDAATKTSEPLVSPGRGLREWLEVVSPLGATRAVTFDTRMDHPKMLTAMDHASHTSAKRLKRAGFPIAADSEHFFVTDVQGPLAPGEIERATAWGKVLAELA
jgi:hypothetical protein